MLDASPRHRRYHTAVIYAILDGIKEDKPGARGCRAGEENTVAKTCATARYALLQGLYWAGFCAVIAYAPVYLPDKGFSGTAIGVTLSAANILAVLITPLLGTLAGRWRWLSVRVLCAVLPGIAALCGVLVYALPLPTVAIAVLFCLAIMLMFTALPFLNALGFVKNASGVTPNFGVGRAGGSLAYAGVSWLLGSMVDSVGTGSILVAFVLLSGLLSAASAAFGKEEAPTQPPPGKEESAAASGLWAFARRNKLFMGVLAANVLLFVCHNICVTYLPQVVTHAGGSSGTYGLVIAAAAIVEAPTMMFFSRIVRRVQCGTLLRVSAVFFGVKALCLLAAGGLGMVFLAQFFQIFSYALFLPASVYYTDLMLPQADKVKGQALMTTSNTAGGVIGSLLGGRLLDVLGVAPMLIAAVAFAAAGAVVMFASARNKGVEMQGTAC